MAVREGPGLSRFKVLGMVSVHVWDAAASDGGLGSRPLSVQGAGAACFHFVFL